MAVQALYDIAKKVETKNKAIEMKIQGYSTKHIRKALNIKNKTQVNRWWKWYRDGESNRFHQQIGNNIHTTKVLRN